MKPKKGTCIGCNKETYIYSKKMCQYCYWKSKPKKPLKSVKKKIQPFSAKKLEELKVYRKLRDDYLKANPICAKCGTKNNLTLHHVKDRLGSNLTDVSNFMTLCLPCHQWVTEHTNEAIKQGFAKSRLKN